MFAQVMRKFALFLICIFFFAVSGAFAQEYEGEDYAGEDLPLSNPFYQPYAGDFYVETGLGYHLLKTQAAFNNVNYNSKESNISSTLNVKYGITDRFIAGVSTDVLIQNDFEESLSGAIPNPSNTSATERGLVQPSISMLGRLLGTRREDWILDIQGQFRLGNKDSKNYQVFFPNNEIDAQIGLGSNSGNWTYAITSHIQYWQFSSLDTKNDKNDKVATATQLQLQYDFSIFYIRSGGGVIKYLDQRSASSPILSKALAVFSAELGIVPSDGLVINASASFVPGTSGTGVFSGIPNTTIKITDLFILSVSIGAKF